MPKRPHIVCLCGSTRFKRQYQDAAAGFSLQGKIVLTCHLFQHQGDSLTAAQKEQLDELHLRKIELADSVFVLNVGGYIGKSTQAEIAHAKAAGKPIHYLVSATRPPPRWVRDGKCKGCAGKEKRDDEL